MTRIPQPGSLEQRDATSESGEGANSASHGWMKVGVIAAASAALGGLAAAWFYRKTLSRLQEAEDAIPDSLPEATGDGAREDF